MPVAAARSLASATALSSESPPSEIVAPVGAARGDLRDRGAGGHEDFACDAVHLRGESDRLGVVARASRNDTTRSGCAERGDLVHRTTDLERTRSLEVLGLQDDVATTSGRERRGLGDGGALHVGGSGRACSEDLVT